MNKVHLFLIRLRSGLLVFLTHNMALPFLRLVRNPKPFPYTKEALKDFPEHSLGKDLLNFLDAKQLELLPYYAKHDIKHILLQYDTTDEGEVCLQSFMLGNGHISFPVAATVIYGFVTMPEYWSRFRIAYRRGKRANCIKDWEWFGLLQQPTQQLIQQIDRHA